MPNLKKYRELKGITQATVARELGISRQTYNNYELGKREADYETLLKLAEFFDTTVENLLSNSSEKNIDSSTNNKDEKIAILFRHLQDIPQNDREQLLNNIESTIDIYLKAKGLK